MNIQNIHLLTKFTMMINFILFFILLFGGGTFLGITIPLLIMHYKGFPLNKYVLILAGLCNLILMIFGLLTILSLNPNNKPENITYEPVGEQLYRRQSK